MIILKESQDWDDIKVNKRTGDKVHFESTFLQQVSDSVDFLKDESKEILKELDINHIDDSALEEFGEKTVNQISDVVDEMSQFKSEIMDSEYVPESVRQSSKQFKKALNRDEDYVRRARRRLKRIDSDEFFDPQRANLRVIELCDKAIEVNKSNSEAYYLKGRALFNLERYVGAIEEFIYSLALKDDIKVWILIADANRLNGDYDDAINVYDSVLKRDENSFDAIKGKAYTYYVCEDYQKADEAFKKANSIIILDDESKEMWDECLDKL